MEFSTKEYQKIVVQAHFKMNGFFFMSYVSKNTTTNKIETESFFKNLEVHCTKPVNVMFLNSLKRSIYFNFCQIICSNSAFVKFRSQKQIYNLKILIENMKKFSEPIFLKLNSKVYDLGQLKKITEVSYNQFVTYFQLKLEWSMLLKIWL